MFEMQRQKTMHGANRADDNAARLQEPLTPTFIWRQAGLTRLQRNRLMVRRTANTSSLVDELKRTGFNIFDDGTSKFLPQQ